DMPAEYASTDPKNAMVTTRPSARQISNLLSDEPVTHFNSRNLSAFVYIWGQFLDHDMSLTPTDTIEYVPILLPPDEKIFTEEIPFYRSQVYPGTGVSKVRQQMNLNTSWIDGSMIYGCDSTRAKWLRTLKDGKMKTFSGNLLPYNTLTGQLSSPVDPHAPDMANDSNHTIKTFVAGDMRAAEHPGLTSLHTVFVREHNRICNTLKALGFKNDEDIYQRARKQVIAEIQVITYQEFLPALGVTLHSYSKYNPNVRPDILNNFATAAYRMGHSLVADEVELVDNNCVDAGPGSIDLVDAFWVPSLVPQYGMEPFLKGLATHKQYETDTRINEVLRNFLFVSPNAPDRFGIDLASLNIQRGRDHGLPNYNAIRKFYTGQAATKFSDITKVDSVAKALQKLYGNVNNIDAWIGLLAEDHLPNSSIGKTMNAVLSIQFEHLRDGDYYFYKNDAVLNLLVANNSKLSDIIKRNTTLTGLQSNVFFLSACPGETGEDVIIQKPVISEIHDYKIYPNPASDILNVELGDLNTSGVIKLFSSQGVLLKTIVTTTNQNNIQLNISSLPGGVYILNIMSVKGTKTFKFLRVTD
ncbi:MAG: peroxidase family protein, partial [Ginsengibacter sp.]